jgi:hypothetical protein
MWGLWKLTLEWKFWLTFPIFPSFDQNHYRLALLRNRMVFFLSLYSLGLGAAE